MVHVYNIFGTRVVQVRSQRQAAVMLRRRRGFFATWNDRTGERWQRRAGCWLQTVAPEAPAHDARLYDEQGISRGGER